MAAPINTNRYRLLLLLYLTFLCLSILSVPASLLESNLYVTRTINYQEELIKKQAARSEVLLKEVNQRLLDTLPKLRNYLFLEKEINRSYLLLDSIDQYLLSSLNDMGTSIDKEYAKRKTVSGLLTKNSLINKIEDTLFLLAKKINQLLIKGDFRSIRIDPTIGQTQCVTRPTYSILLWLDDDQIFINQTRCFTDKILTPSSAYSPPSTTAWFNIENGKAIQIDSNGVITALCN